MKTTASDWKNTVAGKDPRNRSTLEDLAHIDPTYSCVRVQPTIETNLVIAKSTDEEKLNKTERAWLRNLECKHYPFLGIQCMTLKMADDTRYTPDFIVIDENGKLVAYETKGFMRDDAAVKIKVAARQYRFIKFVLVYKDKPIGWKEIEVKP